jgi:hypothetical protein
MSLSNSFNSIPIFLVFDLTLPGIEPKIYHTQGEHAKHYPTDVVKHTWKKLFIQPNRIPTNVTFARKSSSLNTT